jgi:TRAP-type C4-dicarboxylate transport system permease small subunit
VLFLVSHFVLFFLELLFRILAQRKDKAHPTKKKKRFVWFRSSPSRPFTLFLFFFFFTAELGWFSWKVIPQAAATTKQKKKALHSRTQLLGN